MKTEYIMVDDFVKDRKDAAKGIQAAIIYAQEHQINEIIFEKGIYYLRDYEEIETNSIAHDDGCGDIKDKDCHLILQDLEKITLKGFLAEDKSPGTILAGYNSRIQQTLLPSIIWATSCNNLTLKNIGFTREPETASAGIVRNVKNDTIEVEVFEGLPCYDNMSVYCMNRFNLEKKELLGASLTFGFGYDNKFRKTGERTLSLVDASIAQKIKVGDGLSWHQAGKTDFLLFFGQCKNLVLDNIRIYNTNSFGILTENCKNIIAKQLVIKPKGNQLFTGSRDGWKIYRCTGNILLDTCHIEGVRMDGQNIHSNFMIVKEILSENSLLCTCKYAPIPLEARTKMEFYNETEIIENEIIKWEVKGSYFTEILQNEDDSAGKAVIGSKNNHTLYEIHFKEPLDYFVKKDTLMTPKCWEPESYICKNSSFNNIAGAGHLLRCGDVIIENCNYSNIMNAGILMGAEFDTHCEGGHAVNVKITGCNFDNCGFNPRYGEYGCACIAIKSQGFDGPYNQKITIENNKFINSQRALEISDSKEVKLRNNHIFTLSGQ